MSDCKSSQNLMCVCVYVFLTQKRNKTCLDGYLVVQKEFFLLVRARVCVCVCLRVYGNRTQKRMTEKEKHTSN